MTRLTTNDQLRAAKRDWALTRRAEERWAIISPIIDQLIEQAKQEQAKAEAIGEGSGILKMIDRAEHIARARAFLDAITIVKGEVK